MTAPTYTLSGVIANAIDVMRRAGDATPIMVGKHYAKEFGVGAAPRVLFVPEPKGKLGPPLAVGAGEVASMTHSCMVLVRGAEDGTDLGRFDAAYAINDRIMNALHASGAGRLELGDFSDDSPLDADAYGADVVFGFRYSRAVYEDAEIFAAAYALAPADPGSPPDPDRPEGDTGKTFKFTITPRNLRS